MLILAASLGKAPMGPYDAIYDPIMQAITGAFLVLFAWAVIGEIDVSGPEEIILDWFAGIQGLAGLVVFFNFARSGEVLQYIGLWPVYVIGGFMVVDGISIFLYKLAESTPSD